MKTIFLSLALIGCCAAYTLFPPFREVLEVHNSLRSSIAKGTYVAKGTKLPPGANILKMKWDQNLEDDAVRYVNTCPKNVSNTDGVGENLYSIMVDESLNTIAAIDDAVNATKAWVATFQEKGWNSNILDKATFSTETAQAIQMTWAKTGSMGCGYQWCERGQWKKGWSRFVMICKYNVRYVWNEEIYKQGATCSACPPPTKCEEVSGLCVGV
ncbi:hypothetical protein L5515_006839 [Caenorhabditis briggsae]|uniref:SCP domain-containing protein n=1 Tax=Caenorhabditis briggsae TaxID=6238 RepID=A0AAE9EWW2_CAEBR|nr:hypothetical protein L5515_006839 [Caenorhabditis briggsae]